MKYIIVVLIVVTLCACFRSIANNDPLPPGFSSVAQSDLSQTTYSESKSTIPQPFSSFSNGSYWDVSDLSDLLAFIGDTSLKSLKIFSGTFSDLSPLKQLTELEELYIRGSTPNITDISSLSSFVNLKKLVLH
ncbi:MAG: hypothetical protein LBH44_06540 [Treponema sp.]|nr:hypothetical protein [Treponema sp.]